LLFALSVAHGQQNTPEQTVTRLGNLIRNYGFDALSERIGSPVAYRLKFEVVDPCAVTILETFTEEGEGGPFILGKSISLNLADAASVSASASALQIQVEPGKPAMQSKGIFIKPNGESVPTPPPKTIVSYTISLDRADDNTKRMVFAAFNQARDLCRSAAVGRQSERK
jgi:hypothetical protein